jgi:hypothetical protein
MAAIDPRPVIPKKIPVANKRFIPSASHHMKAGKDFRFGSPGCSRGKCPNRAGIFIRLGCYSLWSRTSFSGLKFNEVFGNSIKNT